MARHGHKVRVSQLRGAPLEFMPRVLGEKIYVCRKCGEGYTEGALQELHEKGVHYYRDGWDFICPVVTLANDRQVNI